MQVHYYTYSYIHMGYILCQTLPSPLSITPQLHTRVHKRKLCNERVTHSSLSLLQLIPLVICVGTGAAIRHHHIRLLPFTIQLKRRPDDDERGRSWASAAAGCGKVRMLRMGWFTDRCKYQFRISAANLGGKHAEARSLPRIAQKVRVGESLYILSHRARAQHRRL
jgi:hypothetical protein